MPSPQSSSAPASFTGRDLVVGVVPGQPDVVAETALDWARTSGAATVHFVYVDPSRVHADGTDREIAIDPDSANEDRRSDRERTLNDELRRVAADSGVTWDFRYLVGNPEREIEAVADEVDAAAIVIGTRRRGFFDDLRELVDGSVAVALSRSQKRPVIVVPQHPVADR
ncbi:MAG: universal stress protein [Gordonia sp. (in: high G+C Gram-positive bacteria)]|uniref:universal stress protein n=1 Tax=Gordonia sp. (in: high G+C Gram-positive bacteria) TaxID=84139 RepID=UPI0039E469B0